ncbi:MAG: hypothetical protein ACI9VT_000296 [Psychroserpens sp.]|jgi:hypothetical protein
MARLLRFVFLEQSQHVNNRGNNRGNNRELIFHY